MRIGIEVQLNCLISHSTLDRIEFSHIVEMSCNLDVLIKSTYWKPNNSLANELLWNSLSLGGVGILTFKNWFVSILFVPSGARSAQEPCADEKSRVTLSNIWMRLCWFELCLDGRCTLQSVQVPTLPWGWQKILFYCQVCHQCIGM